MWNYKHNNDRWELLIQCQNKIQADPHNIMLYENEMRLANDYHQTVCLTKKRNIAKTETRVKHLSLV